MTPSALGDPEAEVVSSNLAGSTSNSLIFNESCLGGFPPSAQIRAAPCRNAQAGFARRGYACFLSVPERRSVQRRHGTHHAPSSSRLCLIPARLNSLVAWKSFCAVEAISTCVASHDE